MDMTLPVSPDVKFSEVPQVSFLRLLLCFPGKIVPMKQELSDGELNLDSQGQRGFFLERVPSKGQWSTRAPELRYRMAFKQFYAVTFISSTQICHPGVV